MVRPHIKTVLVTGGAGYIGSHCVLYLKDAGYDVVVVDNLSTGHREAVADSRLIVGDIGDRELLDRLFSDHPIDAVLHFAAHSRVGESVENPAKYYRNNVASGLTLLEAMTRHGVKDLVFSSTCAVYGDPVEIPMTEEHPLAPISPYGRSKMMFEQIAADLARAAGLRPVFLRYFNAAGADPEGRLGEDHKPETHLIPLVIQAALGVRESVTVFGSDYPTDDGTCVRDYIHIVDLADAHLKALERLDKGGEPAAFNLGNGSGYSVRQVIDTVKKVTGEDIEVIEGERREGDPAVLVGSAEKAGRVLGWRPRFHDLESIIETAYLWHKRRPGGYGESPEALLKNTTSAPGPVRK